MSRILITGCSKGLGRATALELSRRGHEVVATARRPESLASLPVAARLALDVRDAASVRRAAAEAGRVDVLVNNAGEIAVGPLESIPFDEIQKLYDINVFGTLRTIQAFAPAMRERGSGTIVNISSVVGRLALPLTGIYASTKWAIEALSEALRIELGHFGVKVVVIEPGQVGTGALDAPRDAARADDAARDHRAHHRRRRRGARAEVPLAGRPGRRGDAHRPRPARRFLVRRGAALGVRDRLVTTEKGRGCR